MGRNFGVSFAEPELLEAIDAWPPRWSWQRIADTHAETYVVTMNGAPLLAMAAPKSRALRLADSRCYRLDYVEVAPPMRGQGWGALALVLAAHRARELGASGLVMGALPARVPWLRRLGATEPSKHVWKAESGAHRPVDRRRLFRHTSRAMRRELGKNFERLMNIAANAETELGSVIVDGEALELMEAPEIEIDWAVLGPSASGDPLGTALPNRFMRTDRKAA